MISMEDTDVFKVIMRNAVEGDAGTTWAFEATDFVPKADIDAYVTDARKRWSSVEVV